MPVDDFECRKQYNYILDVPVLSFVTSITYASIYGAQCRDDHHQLAKWNASIECSHRMITYIRTIPRNGMSWQLISVHYFYSYNITKEEIVRQENYRSGRREWVLPSTLTVDGWTVVLVATLSSISFQTFRNMLIRTAADDVCNRFGPVQIEPSHRNGSNATRFLFPLKRMAIR